MLFLLALGGLGYRLHQVQVEQHGRFAELALGERTRKVPLPSKRGSIFDRNGETLVKNEPVQHVVADRNILENLRICARGLSKAKGISSRQLVKDFAEEELRSRYAALVSGKLDLFFKGESPNLLKLLKERPNLVRIPLLRNVRYEDARSFAEMLRVERIAGIRFEDGVQRFYPNPRYLSHVLGYTNSKYEGQEGIEKSMDSVLKGTDGYRVIEVGGNGEEIAAYRGREVPALDGKNVHLTVDMGLQMIVERALDQAVAEYSPEKVTIIFMDPFTGEILAMGNRPDYNLATRAGDPNFRRNLAVSDRYEPGSTFKLVTVAAAYDSRAVSERDVFFCHEGHYVESRSVFIRDHHPYGELTPPQIIVKSSNIGSYLLAREVGARRLHDYTKAFGFGQRTGVDLTGETSGLVLDPDSRNWSAPTLSRVAMGYSIDMSALQMLNAVSTIANGGQLMRPHIVERVTNDAGATIEQNRPEAIRRVISEETAAMVRRAMIGVTLDGGTATRAAIDGYTVAGKTGTAQKPKSPRSAGYWNNRYVVSFTGFLPAENPKIAGIVVVDDPTKKEGEPSYGGTVAAPLFKEVAERAMRHYGIEPSLVRRKVTRSAPRSISAEFLPVSLPR
ncbi:MAG: penicillin-binding protein 2 [Verrucomicrobiota bacterium]